MSQRRLLFLFCLAIGFLFLVHLTHAGGDLRVDESRTRFVLHQDSIEVLFAVENLSGRDAERLSQTRATGHSKLSSFRNLRNSTCRSRQSVTAVQDAANRRGLNQIQPSRSALVPAPLSPRADSQVQHVDP